MPQKKTHNSVQQSRFRIAREKTAFILFIVGAIFIFVSTFYFFNKQTSIWFAEAPKNQSISRGVKASNQPVRIEISSLSLSLPITEASIAKGKWEVSEHGVSHLDSSAVPQTTGNIILYGHNKTSILGKITNLKKGSIITIKTRDRNIYSYIVEKTSVVSPRDVKVLESRGTETLTLYTCTGFADLKRFVVKANPL